MASGINKVIRNGNGNAILYTALIAAMVANVLPTPFDAIYFDRQRKLKQDLEAGRISVERYWYQDIGEYYLWTALWYAGVILVVSAVGSSFKANSRMAIALISGGLVVGVMVKNIQKDKEMQELKKDHSR